MSLSSKLSKIANIMNTKQALNQFLKVADNKKYGSKLTSVFYRYVCPRYGFSHYEDTHSKRLSASTKTDMLNFLARIDTKEINSFVELFESSVKYNKKSKGEVATYKNALIKFVDFCKRNGFIESKVLNKPVVQDKKIIVERFISKRIEKPKQERKKYTSMYGLMCRTAIPGSTRKKLMFEGDYINPELEEDLRKIEQHWAAIGFKAKTTESYIKRTLRYLGWLHRYKNKSLEELRLSSIIYYTPISYIRKDLEESYEDYLANKTKTELIAREVAMNNFEEISEYFDFLLAHSQSKAYIKESIKFIKSIAKYIYHKEVLNSTDMHDYDDVPIIKKLNIFNRTIERNRKPVVPYSTKTVAWQTVLDIYEDLRIRSIATHYTNEDGTLTAITDTYRYINLQKFLAVALSVIIPTDRSRTYYELEVGHTFVLGDYSDGFFTPKKDMVNPRQAKWYIHLTDYKTSKVYGEYWSLPIPNIKYSDGTKFYDYIDRWITKGRNYRENFNKRQKVCQHNKFFRGNTSLSAFSASGWGEFIKYIFQDYTGVPVTTNCLRHMYVTEERRCGANHEELKASAYARHHSLNTAEKTYNEQSLHEKIQAYGSLTYKMLRIDK